MHPRNIESELRAALADTPVVLINGARQTGKSTLVVNLAKELGATYVTLDDATALSAASSDAAGFLSGLGVKAVIDEVHKAPALFPAIKVLVDSDRRPGRFLLSGSANVLMLPQISESLAGRMEIITLYPLSQSELHGQRGHFVEGVFAAELPALTNATTSDLTTLVLAGGYPEAVQRSPGKRREAWFASYITAILQRDVRDLAHIEGLTEIPRLLALLAARVGALLNISELSRSVGIPHTTLKRYLGLLEATFILQPLSAWSTNLGKRLIRSPKIHLTDTGLTAHLTGLTKERVASDHTLFGPLLESFVVGELRKQATWADMRLQLYHYSTTTGREVDVILEDAAGRIVGIEVKASASVSQKDFAGLQVLAQDTGKQFVRGIVFYTGEQSVAFGQRHLALPVSALWRMTR